MRILVTGSKGFIASHFVPEAISRGHSILGIDIDSSEEEVADALDSADGILHLAGFMRPKFAEQFSEVNDGLTTFIIDHLALSQKKCPIVFASSTQASLDNPYGRAKKECEDMLKAFSAATGNPVFVFRLSNTFGPGGRPNYNSVLATFCYNLLHHLPIRIDNPTTVVPFIYVEDVVSAFLDVFEFPLIDGSKPFYSVTPVYPCSLSDLASLIENMVGAIETGQAFSCADQFEECLLKTLLSYKDK